jgi:hypothetical protein
VCCAAVIVEPEPAQLLSTTFQPRLPQGDIAAFSRSSFAKGFFRTFFFAKKVCKKGAPKTKTAVFGWFFEELLCMEVKRSRAVVSAPERTSLSFKRTLFLSFLFFFVSPKKNGQQATRKRRRPFSGGSLGSCCAKR